MITLKKFLIEEAGEDKLKHLEHVEDHVINSGSAGFSHAFHSLNDVHSQLLGQKNETKMTVKYDGSPSVVFGTHPKTGKFFVGSKSVFNKDPKINYTNKDIAVQSRPKYVILLQFFHRSIRECFGRLRVLGLQLAQAIPWV